MVCEMIWKGGGGQITRYTVNPHHGGGGVEIRSPEKEKKKGPTMDTHIPVKVGERVDHIKAMHVHNCGVDDQLRAVYGRGGAVKA